MQNDYMRRIENPLERIVEDSIEIDELIIKPKNEEAKSKLGWIKNYLEKIKGDIYSTELRIGDSLYMLQVFLSNEDSCFYCCIKSKGLKKYNCSIFARYSKIKGGE